MGVRNKYLVGDKHFSFLCDASEWSWQLCRAFISKMEDQDKYIVREVDDMSFGVVEKGTYQIIHREKVKLLV